METNNLVLNFKNISLRDQSGNIYKIAVSSTDYGRIINEPAFATMCLNQAIEIGIIPEKEKQNSPSPLINSESQLIQDESAVPNVNANVLNEDSGDGKRWSRNAVLLLIDLFQTYKMEFESSRKKKDIWVKISQGLKEKDHIYSPDECDNKWRNLKTSYKRVKDKSNKTGRGKQNWEFFDAMDEVLCSEHSINPVNLLFSSRSPSGCSTSNESISDIGKSSSSSNSTPTTRPSSPISKASSSSSLNVTPQDDGASVHQRSKKRKYKNNEAPDWFLQWTEDNKKMEENAQKQAKNFQDEILKRLDAKNSTLEKIADAFFKM